MVRARTTQENQSIETLAKKQLSRQPERDGQSDMILFFSHYLACGYYCQPECLDISVYGEYSAYAQRCVAAVEYGCKGSNMGVGATSWFLLCTYWLSSRGKIVGVFASTIRSVFLFRTVAQRDARHTPGPPMIYPRR